MILRICFYDFVYSIPEPCPKIYFFDFHYYCLFDHFFVFVDDEIAVFEGIF